MHATELPDETPTRAVRAFTAPRDDLRAALAEPVRLALPELGVIAVRGVDAASFLQTQLTGDVVGLAQDGFQLNGYCTPKGRLLATFHAWRDGDEIRLALPRELLAPVMKRLSMFVLRAKAALVDNSDACRLHAIVGPGAELALGAAGIQAPAAAWSSTIVAGLRVARLPGHAATGERFLLAAGESWAWPATLDGLRRVDSGVWWWSEVATALPTVFASTQEKFVPQMINLEVLGGVSFRKGCYPGQEIVARSQYLGKLKRRMHFAHVERDDGLAPGADILDDSGPIGTVVLAAAAPTGGFDLLFEAPVDRAGSAALRAVRADGAPLALRPLPYEFFDPTQ